MDRIAELSFLVPRPAMQTVTESVPAAGQVRLEGNAGFIAPRSTDALDRYEDRAGLVSSANLRKSMFPPLTTATILPVPHFPLSAAATAQAPAPSAMT